MTATDFITIERIRAASRRLVRELGFMEATLAGSDLSPSAVHAIIEIGTGRSVTARDLARTLRLEKSTVSRLLKGLVGEGLAEEARDTRDTRMKRLALTERGRACLAGITDYAVDQVAEATAALSGDETRAVAEALEAYAGALARAAARAEEAPDPVISAGWRPGLIGRMLQMHSDFYARRVGFGAGFESGLAADMGDFFARLDTPGNGVWSADLDGRMVGTIAIDGEDLGEDLGGDVAHLRWFIMAEGLQGRGVGRRLLQTALDFVDARGMRETRLWTFQGLDAARRLYERAGFELVEEKPGRRWGGEVLEQQFARPRP